MVGRKQVIADRERGNYGNKAYAPDEAEGDPANQPRIPRIDVGESLQVNRRMPLFLFMRVRLSSHLIGYGVTRFCPKRRDEMIDSICFFEVDEGRALFQEEWVPYPQILLAH